MINTKLNYYDIRNNKRYSVLGTTHSRVKDAKTVHLKQLGAKIKTSFTPREFTFYFRPI